MSNFIEELYYGNIEPTECTTELTVNVKKNLNELAEKEQQLMIGLSGKDKELFIDYTRVCNKFTGESNADSFTVGFRLGARFAYDTFVDK